MGRKPKNQFTEHDIANTPNSEFKLFDVKLPFAVIVEFSERVDPSGKKPFTGIGTEIIYKPISEKDKIIVEFKKNGYDVISINPWTVKFTDFCPACKNSGVSIIQIKDNTDNRNRTWKYQTPRTTPLPKRPKEYWLVYNHKTNPKKCRIQQCITTPHPAFKNNTRKIIDIEKFFFPHCLEWMKQEKELEKSKS